MSREENSNEKKTVKNENRVIFLNLKSSLMKKETHSRVQLVGCSEDIKILQYIYKVFRHSDEYPQIVVK